MKVQDGAIPTDALPDSPDNDAEERSDWRCLGSDPETIIAQVNEIFAAQMLKLRADLKAEGCSERTIDSCVALITRSHREHWEHRGPQLERDLALSAGALVQ